MTRPVGSTVPKNTKAIRIGFTTLCTSSPNFSHSRLSGRKAVGYIRVVIRKITVVPPVQRHEWPPCHQLSSDMTKNAAVITIPNDRSELPTTGSSREKLSWIVFCIRLALPESRLPEHLYHFYGDS